jgi:hypothetical protein
MSLNPNGSHLPALMACVVVTDGPVLELGMGIFSTPVLHSLCYGSRRLLSIDEDQTAIYNFCQLMEREHEIRHDFDYRSLDELARQPWSVVLVDHWPSGRRAADALKFLTAEYVIVHDAEVPEIGPVILKQARSQWPHIQMYERFQPSTLILKQKEIPSLV